MMKKDIQNIREESPICRRFAIKDESKKQATVALIQQKGLSREDVTLLLSTLTLKEQNI